MKTIEDLVDNHEYNDALRKTCLGKMDREVYESLPIGPLYDAILKKKLVKKKERCGIAEEVLVEVGGFVYPLYFVILDIEENEYMPLILGTPFLTTTRADIRCSDGSMKLRAGNFKVRFIKTLRFPKKVKKKKRNDLDLIIPINHVNRRILEWEERIEKC
ncbi:zinc finger, CCHC-type containing protein [Tanacetum coccineum]